MKKILIVAITIGLTVLVLDHFGVVTLDEALALGQGIVDEVKAMFA